MINPKFNRVLALWRGYRTADAGREVRKISDVMPGAMARLGLRDRYKENVLQETWREMMGEFVARHTRPTGVYRNVLTVEVDHSTWLQEMSLFHKKIMLENLRRRFTELEIRDIRFRLAG